MTRVQIVRHPWFTERAGVHLSHEASLVRGTKEEGGGQAIKRLSMDEIKKQIVTPNRTFTVHLVVSKKQPPAWDRTVNRHGRCLFEKEHTQNTTKTLAVRPPALNDRAGKMAHLQHDANPP